MKIAVVGGGIFGVTTAITLSKNFDVTLFEKSNEILKAASGSNQYRVHRGYHYPRSKDTVLGIQKSENSFKKMYNESIVDNYEHFYCISKNDSLTTAEQFIEFCNEFDLEFEESNSQIVNEKKIDLSVKVKESIYDPEKLRDNCWKKLKENNVDVRLNSEFLENDYEDYDNMVINASASSMWVANSSTIAPSTDTENGKLNLLTANLNFTHHRRIEAPHADITLNKVF